MKYPDCVQEQNESKNLIQDTLHITGLEPLIAPESVDLWPPAPGWYVIMALAFVAIGFLVITQIRNRRKNVYRREALTALRTLGSSNGDRMDSKQIASLNRLLKITAMKHYPREQVASLSGEDWLRFLNLSCKKVDFTASPGELLATTGYQDPEGVDISRDQWNHLMENIDYWIRNHR